MKLNDPEGAKKHLRLALKDRHTLVQSAYNLAVLVGESDPAEAASICTGVADREPVDAGTSFSVATDRLYCFSKIVNITEATEIVHVWYFGETERARVSLGIKPPAWRTYSSKIIQTHEIGPWRVEILDASGNLLETLKFEVTQ